MVAATATCPGNGNGDGAGVSDLRVDFAGDVREVADRLSFGRTADLEIDTNPHLHRLVGEFVRDGNLWWVRNLGSRLFITIVGDDGSRTDLPPGAQHVLASACGTILVAVGQARYEIDFETGGVGLPSSDDADDSDVPVGSTTPFYSLTAREVDFLVSFARPILDGTNGPMPTYADVAGWWGVSPSTLDNTLRSLKKKMQDARLIRDEKLDTMVRVAVSHSLVTIDDLEWSGLIDGTPRPALEGHRFRPADT